VSRPVQGTPKINQVLLFDDPDHPGRLRLHRFVRVDEQGRMITRGDANTGDDSSPITLSQVRGVAILRVPFLGRPITWAREGRWFEVSLVGLGLIMLLAGSRLVPGTDKVEDAVPARAIRRTRSAAPRRALVEEPAVTVRPKPRPGWARPARIGLATISVAGLLLAAGAIFERPAWSAYSNTASNAGSSLAAAPFYTCRSAVLASAPAIYYRLDETSGSSAADSSGNGRTGTYQGSVTKGVGRACSDDAGSAVTLNGSSGYISTPTAMAGPNVFTVQTWFKTTTNRGGRLIGFGNSRTGTSTSTDRHIYMTNAGRLIFGVRPASGIETITSPDSYNDGDWHQVSASLSSSGMKLYVDGELVASDSGVTSGQSMTGYVKIGFDALTGWPSAPTSRHFGGSLDDVAYYSSALSANTIAQQYAAA
jgi:hypothetical protein